jgi:hypothetical protein
MPFIPRGYSPLRSAPHSPLTGSLGAVGQRAGVATTLRIATPSWAFLRSHAGSASNVGLTISEDFATAAVNTGANKITLGTDYGFRAFSSFSSSKGSMVKFRSSGVLPAPLDATKRYFVVQNASKEITAIYPETAAGDYTTTPGAFDYENMLVGQNFAQAVNAITLTSQGTGTHTIYSEADKLLSVLDNSLDASINTQTQSGVDPHCWMDVFKDGNGKSYIRMQRFCRNNLTSSAYSIYSKTFPQNGSGGKLAARQKIGSKRCAAIIFKIKFHMSSTKSFGKAAFTSANVNTTTDTLTYTASGDGVTLVTGEPTNIRAISGGTLPTTGGVALNPATTYYARVSGTAVTLHPTAADANGNTNKIDLDGAGTGTFQLYQTSIVGDGERMRFPIEWLEPANGGAANVCNPQHNALSPGDAIQVLATDVVVATGSTNGNWGFTGRTAVNLCINFGDGVACNVDFPPGATPPTRADTGLPMSSGIYYMSRNLTSSTSYRLHDTKVSATASTGVTTALSSCIKFNNVPAAGRVIVKATPDNRIWNVTNCRGGNQDKPGWIPPLETTGFLGVVVDYNDTAANLVHYRAFWVAEANASAGPMTKVADWTSTGSTIGLLDAAQNDGNNAWTLGNSAAGHVGGECDIYEVILGASANAIADTDFALVAS